MRYPAMYVPVEIVEGVNDLLWIVITETTALARIITPGTYRDLHELLTEVSVRMGVGFTASLSRDGKTVGWTHESDAPRGIDWGFDSRTRGLASVLGFDPDAPFEWLDPGKWTYGTRAPRGWWTSDMPVAVDEGDMPDEEEVQTRALSGYRQTSILSPVRKVREVRIDLLLARHMWARAEVIPGESFESAIWPHRHRVRYFSDRNDPSSGADYVITEPQGRLRPARYQGREDVARYVLSLEMERLVGGGP